MKKAILISGLFLVYFSGVLMADKTGVGKERNQDRTGSPFAVSSTQQCDKCHSGGNFNSAIQLRLKDSNGNIVTEYNGGESYTYEVEVTGSGSRFGFQSVALLSSNNANAGTLSVSSSNTRITTLGGTRLYGEHLNPSTTGLFVMNWVAPAPGSGTVKFYASGNNVNNDVDDTGDDPVNTLPMTITESATSAVQEMENKKPVLMYTNPAESSIQFEFEEIVNCKIEIYDAVGRLMMTGSMNDSRMMVDISNWHKGMYWVVFSGDIMQTEQFIK